MLKNLIGARKVARQKQQSARQKYLSQIRDDNANLSLLMQSTGVSKIALAMLFLTEGSKRSGSLVFCNSDPRVIELFLHLLRYCYKLGEEKFRCTVQCRADQNVQKLESFWSGITGIPIKQFCKAQIDKRSVGKPTKKDTYMGVCRIDYYSAHIFNELSEVVEILYKGH